MGGSNWMTAGVTGAGVTETARQKECPPTIRTADRTGSQTSTAFTIDGHRHGAEVPLDLLSADDSGPFFPVPHSAHAKAVCGFEPHSRRC
jgi:hypothetical protein